MGIEDIPELLLLKKSSAPFSQPEIADLVGKIVLNGRFVVMDDNLSGKSYVIVKETPMHAILEVNFRVLAEEKFKVPDFRDRFDGYSGGKISTGDKLVVVNGECTRGEYDPIKAGPIFERFIEKHMPGYVLSLK